MNLEEATRALETDPSWELVNADADRWGPDGADTALRWLPRFVDALESHPRACSISLLHFRFGAPGLRGHAIADDEDDIILLSRTIPIPDRPAATAAATAAVWRLFGSVLPNHPALVSFGFTNCYIEPQLLRSFFEAMPPHKELQSFALLSSSPSPGYFGPPSLDPECFRIVAKALAGDLCRDRDRDRVPVRIQDLFLYGVHPSGYRAVIAAAASNASVQVLDVSQERRPAFGGGGNHDDDDGVGDPFTADDVRSVLGGDGVPPSTSIRRFPIYGGRVGAAWAPTFLGDVARRMRTNTHLEDLEFVDMERPHSPEDVEALVDLVQTYNFTLRHVSLGGGHPELYRQEEAIRHILRRNQRLVEAYWRLEAAHQQVPRVGRRRRRGAGDSKPLWPEAIVRIHRFPTLLYRYLRHGGRAVAMLENAGGPARPLLGGRGRPPKRQRTLPS